MKSFIMASICIVFSIVLSADTLQYIHNNTLLSANTPIIINSDYGPRNKSDDDFEYDFHGGIDYGIPAHDLVLSIVDGTIKKIVRSGTFIYLAIESPSGHHYAYEHLFPTQLQMPVVDGNFVFTQGINSNNDIVNAILYFGVTPPKIYVDADNVTVTYNNVTYTPAQTTRTVNAGDPIGPCGGSGGYSPHLHLGLIEDINASSLLGDANSNNPFLYIDHQTNDWEVQPINQANGYCTLNYNQCSTIRARIQAVADRQNYSNLTGTIEQVSFLLRKAQDTEYALIQGPNYVSNIKYGGGINETAYPSRIYTTCGSISDTGVYPHMYDDGAYDNFYFSDFLVSIHRTNIHSTANHINDARYPDGTYYLKAVITTIDDDVTECEFEDPIVINRFKTNLTGMTIRSGSGRRLYEGNWTWDGEDMVFSSTDYSAALPADYLTFRMTTSEPMNNLSLELPELNSGVLVATPVDGYNDMMWQVEYQLVDVPRGTYSIEVTGIDAQGDELQADPSVVSIRYGDTFWSPTPCPGADTSHSLKVEAPEREPLCLVLSLDVSGGMSDAYYIGNDRYPYTFPAAMLTMKHAICRLLHQLEVGDYVSLVSFASETFPLGSPTFQLTDSPFVQITSQADIDELEDIVLSAGEHYNLWDNWAHHSYLGRNLMFIVDNILPNSPVPENTSILMFTEGLSDPFDASLTNTAGLPDGYYYPNWIDLVKYPMGSNSHQIAFYSPEAANIALDEWNNTSSHNASFYPILFSQWWQYILGNYTPPVSGDPHGLNTTGLLQKICESSDGYMRYCKRDTLLDTIALAGIADAVVNELAGYEEVDSDYFQFYDWDYWHGSMEIETEHETTFFVDSLSTDVKFLLSWDRYYSSHEMELMDPVGVIVTSAYPGVDIYAPNTESNTYRMIDVFNPMPGTWTMTSINTTCGCLIAGNELEFHGGYKQDNLCASAYVLSNLHMDINTYPESPNSQETVFFNCTISDGYETGYGADVDVTINTYHKWNDSIEIPLYDYGVHGSNLPGDGTYVSSYSDPRAIFRIRHVITSANKCINDNMCFQRKKERVSYSRTSLFSQEIEYEGGIWNWICFPKLYNNPDGDSYAEFVLSPFFTMPYTLQHYMNAIKCDGSGVLQIPSEMSIISSPLGYKLYFDEDAIISYLPTGELYDESALVQLRADQENWIGYFCEETTSPEDAFATAFSHLYAIEAQDWSMKKIDGVWRYSGAPSTRPWMEYGKGYVVRTDRDVSFMWNTSIVTPASDRQEPLIFSFEDKPEYHAILIDTLDVEEDPLEVAVYQGDTCIGATVFEEYPIQILAYVEEDSVRQDSLEIQFVVAYDQRSLCTIDHFDLLNESTMKYETERTKIPTNERFHVLRMSDDDGVVSYTSAQLSQNFPNPFNPTTTINFSIPQDSHVELCVYNIRGQRVKKLADDEFPAGNHNIEWSGKDEHGRQVASGVYLYRLMVNGKKVGIKKMLLLK